MDTIQEEEFAIDPEQAAIWNDDSDIDLSQIPREEEVSEIDEPQPIEEDEIVDELPEEEEIVEEDEELEQPEDLDSSQDNDITDNVPEDETLEEDNSEASEEKVTPETYKVKANNMEFDFSIEELTALAPKAMDYTKKMQEIAPWRKTISALKEQGLGEQDVNLMIDVLKGDKTAIGEVLKRTGVDTLDLDIDEEQPYQPNDYGKTEQVQRIEEIVTTISADPEYRITEQVIDSQWDVDSRSAMAQNPDMIMGLHQDIKNGVYDKVAPIAFKMKAMNVGTPGMSDLDYYIAAGKEFYSQEQNTQIQEQKEARQTRENNIQTMAPKRKAAAPSRTNSSKRDVIDYLAEDDESFDEWYKDLMSKS